MPLAKPAANRSALSIDSARRQVDDSARGTPLKSTTGARTILFAVVRCHGASDMTTTNKTHADEADDTWLVHAPGRSFLLTFTARSGRNPRSIRQFLPHRATFPFDLFLTSVFYHCPAQYSDWTCSDDEPLRRVAVNLEGVKRDRRPESDKDRPTAKGEADQLNNSDSI